MEFNQDVRAGLAHYLERTCEDIGEMYDVDLEAIRTGDVGILLSIPDGIDSLIACLTGLAALLSVSRDDHAQRLIQAAHEAMIPLVMASMSTETIEQEVN